MKKVVISGLSATLVAAGVWGFSSWCWDHRETAESRRAARKDALVALKKAGPAEIIPFLREISSTRVFQTYFKNEKWYGWRFGWFTRVPSDFIAQLAESAFIRFSGDGTPGSEDLPHLKELIVFSEELVRACDTPAAAAALRERRLDGYFFTGDFNGAIAELEKGIPGRTEAWCKGTIAKLRAHQAVEARNWKEAIKQFLAFGEFLKEKEMADFEDCDPATGVIYSIEWVIARNFMRCAEYSRKLGENDAAKAYEAQAKPFFAKALEKAKDDPKSLETLQKEMKDNALTL